MNILVTGAAGFVGSHLSEKLAALGHRVTGLDCVTDYYDTALKHKNVADLKSKGVETLPLDLAHDALDDAVQGIDAVFHLAAQPGIASQTPFEDYLNNNIIATQRLLEAVRRANTLKGFINIATSSVYGADATGDETTEPKPTSYYGVTKLAAEQLVLAAARERGLPATSLRLFSVYGPRERPDKLFPTLIRSLLEDKPFPLHEGSDAHARSFTFVSDIVDGMVAALEHLEDISGHIFNIGTDTSITTGEAIRLVEDIIGKPVTLERKPKRTGDQLKTHATIHKARALLGYEPSVSPLEGLTRTVAWARAQRAHISN